MKFKIKPWMIYFFGIPVVYGIGLVAIDNLNAFSLVGEYLLWGAIGLGIYYLTKRLWFGKQNKPEKINKYHLR